MRLFLVFLACFFSPPAFASPNGRAEECEKFFRGLGQAVFTEELPNGPRLRLPALPGARKAEEMKELRFGAYNVLNLQSSVGKWEWKDGARVRVLDPHVKPAWAREAVAKEILARDADFLFLEEVEGFPPLVEFNKDYLKGAFRPLMIRGNDSRGIEIAILVKKDFPFDVDILSHANVMHNDPVTAATEPLFSRDAPVVLLRPRGAQESERPVLALVGTHLKSQRDAPGDPGSVKMRTHQAEGVLRLLKGLQEKYADLPVIMAGDFNTDVRTAPELKPLWEAGMKDSFALGEKPIPEKFRVTQTYHPKPDPQGPELPAVNSQLDAILLNKSAVDLDIVEDTRIVVHLDENGKPRPLPNTFHERSMNPSDHHMVFGIFDFAKIFAHWKAKRVSP